MASRRGGNGGWGQFLPIVALVSGFANLVQYKQQTTVEQERDQERASRQAADRVVEATQRERDLFLRERDEARRELNQARQERDTFRRERDEARRERDEARLERDRLRAQAGGASDQTK